VKVSLGLPTHRVDLGEEMTSGEAIATMAWSAESAGFDAVFVTDHPIPDERFLRAGGHHSLDPFVVLSAAAVATTELRLHTNLLVLAYRNPFLSAKAVASLDVVSGGRVILGIGAGYLEAEFAALGADFSERNALTDEAIAAMKAAWSGEPVTMAGRGFTAEASRALPRPVQRPHPPIWVGGNSRRAIRRAVELADGWMPMPNPARMAPHVRTPALESLDDLRQRLGMARSLAAECGRRAPLEVVFMPTGTDMMSGEAPRSDRIIESAADLASAGVSYLTLTLPGDSRSQFLDNVSRFGEEVLPALAALSPAPVV
jgi:probable F420-dependent oxidoreductase